MKSDEDLNIIRSNKLHPYFQFVAANSFFVRVIARDVRKSAGMACTLAVYIGHCIQIQNNIVTIILILTCATDTLQGHMKLHTINKYL